MRQNPNNKTLDTLSKFIAIKIIFIFLKITVTNEKIDLTDIVYKTVSENNSKENY